MTLTSKLKFEECSGSGSDTPDCPENNPNPNHRDQSSQAQVYSSYTFSSPPTSRVVRRQGSLANEEGYTDLVDGQQSHHSEAEVNSIPPNSKKVITASEYYARKEKEFQDKLLEVKGFVIKEMISDGACMFRAVAHQVYGDQEMHKLVRKSCMDYMVQNDDFFSKYIPEDFESYIKRKRKDRTYGDHVEIQALSEIYNRPIEVYQYSPEPINTFISCYQNSNGNPPIRLSYHGNIHYNSIIDPKNLNVGVGLGLAGYKTHTETDTEEKEISKNIPRTDVEEAIIEDKLKVTDWEATDEHLAHITAWQSYIEWMHGKKTVSKGTTLMDTNTDDCVPGTSFTHKFSPGSSPQSSKRFQHKQGYSISGASLSEDKPNINLTDDASSPKTKSEDVTGKKKVTIVTENEDTRSLNENDHMVGYEEGEDSDHDLTIALAQSRREYLDSFK